MPTLQKYSSSSPRGAVDQAQTTQQIQAAEAATNSRSRVWLLCALLFAAAAIVAGYVWPTLAKSAGGFYLQVPFREASLWQDWPGVARTTVTLLVEGQPKLFGVFQDSFVAQPGDTWFVYGLHGYQAAARTTAAGESVQWQSRHNGIDFVAAPGLTVRAAADGEVIFAGDAFGQTVVMQHERGFQTTYGYLKDVTVKVGD